LNSKTVFHVIGNLVIIVGISMLFSAGIAVLYHESVVNSILISALTTILAGAVMNLFTRNHPAPRLRDAMFIVSLGWIIIVFFSALPYYFSGILPHFTDAYFEATSGLTTTGSSVLGGQKTMLLEDIPRGILFWRSFTHFIGGMGIIVFYIAILPMSGVGGNKLFETESPGPSITRLTPRIKHTGRILWTIYTGMTFLETVILRVAGMDWFDAICTSFGTIATGGFATRSGSIGDYHSAVIEWIIIVFMILSATNFTLHFQSLTQRKWLYWRNSEFKAYILIMAAGILLVSLNISGGTLAGWLDSLRKSTFTVVSIGTTTGFSTENFDQWPALSRMVIFFLLFSGGCSGSTSGAVKTIRSILVFKYIGITMKRILHPTALYHLRINGKPISDDIVTKTLGFFLLYILIAILSTICLSAMNIEIISAASASATALGGVGPGLNMVGPTHIWADFPTLAKWLMSFVMLLGRLEIFSLLVLFNRKFWAK